MRMTLRTWLIAALAALPVTARAAEPPPAPTDTLLVQHPEIVVSATRTARDQVNVPNGTSVITGKELRRRGTRTVAEALQDVVGIDTGEGSDNGSRLPNVGMWGLKEFDALLFTLNGVPVGGPFNPSLSQIPIEDVDRVEIAKGPQGTMYGVSAFAGMINVFTPHTQAGGMVTAGGGSFSSGQGSFGWGKPLEGDKDFRVNGSFARSDGWQDRTESNVGRGGASLGMPLGAGRLRLDVSGFQDHQDWGSPLPYDSGALLPGFVIDRNYAFQGAEVKHQVFSGTAQLTWPTGTRHRFENTLGFTRDHQTYTRSFPGEVDPFLGDTLESEGLSLDPKETSLYEDARWLANFEGKGTHELVTGAALTWGKTRGTAREYRFDQLLSDYSSIPSVDQLTPVDNRDFEDMRVFLGLYAHDAWTPVPRLTLEGGGRLDIVSEELETEADLPGGPVQVKDNRDDTGFSGDLSALWRLVPEAAKGRLEAANLYASVRRGFKPAAPNLAEAEAAEILAPEHTTSWEVGLKSRAFQGLAFDISWFDMTFKNMVVSVMDTLTGLPDLTNSGEQRFKGIETDVRWSPESVPGVSLGVGYAHHDARFVDFKTPSGVDVSGNQLELVPRDMVSGRLSYVHATGLGGFAAIRYQGERPFNRRNTFFTDAYTEYDAGVSYDHTRWRLAVVGRNLGDDRHVVTESEIGDSQFYVAPPRRFSAEVGYRF